MSDDKKPATNPDAKPKAEQPPRPDKTQHRPGQRAAINTERFTEKNISINSTREED